MHRVLLWLGFIIFSSCLFPIGTYAQVVINEIYANPQDEIDEFIEIYNIGESEIDLANWKIADLVKTYTITDQKIGPRSFVVLEKVLTGIALNNSNETISLFDSEDNNKDAFTYDLTFENTSWSRVPDGVGSFSNNTPLTKGVENATPPTPTFTPTLTPTSIPKPSKSPTPIKSPTSTIAPAIKPTEIKEIKSPKVSPTKSLKVNKALIVTTTQVKGASDEMESEKIIDENEKTTPSYVYSITTGIGMLILACVILVYKKIKSKNEEDDF